MFSDRRDAGAQLADRLMHLQNRQPVVLALPRGGVAVGFEVARRLAAPLDLVLVRKIGAPMQPELALGAVAEGGASEAFIDERLAKVLAVPPDYIRAETAREIAELERRRQVYRAGRPPVPVQGSTAIVVDDGIATGATMRVALRAVRHRGPAYLVLAAPVAAVETLDSLRDEADETVCVEPARGLGAIGFYYADFHQMTDQEVTEILALAAVRASPPS